MVFLSKKQRPVPRRRLGFGAAPKERATAPDGAAHQLFQRNRTLTGSLSSGVASANEHRSELKSARVHAHHLRKHRRHAFGALVTILLVSGGLLFLLSQAIVTVTVKASGTSSAIPDTYKNLAHEYLLRHPLERFRFSLNLASLAKYMQTHSAPEVESFDAQITPTSFGEAQLSIALRHPVVAWQTGGTRMYVDAHGNTFQRNYYQEPSVQVVDQTGIQAQNNQVLTSNRFLGFIGKIIGRMKEGGYTVKQITLPANTTRQVQVVVGELAYPMKFSIDRPVGEQAEDAMRAVRYLALKHIAPEYLDVRVSGKAYYR